MTWIMDVSERRNPSLSASRIATSDTSGISRPSRRRLIPTSTSKTPARRSRMISALSMVATSEWRYRTFTPASVRKSVRSSAIFLVRVVISTLSWASSRLWISPRRSSICPSMGRTSILGSKRPVGRIICSARFVCTPIS